MEKFKKEELAHFQNYKWISSFELSTRLQYFVDFINEIAKNHTGHDFRACMKIELKHSYSTIPSCISIGWGKANVNGTEYYADYYLSEDRLEIVDYDGDETYRCVIENALDEYNSIVASKAIEKHYAYRGDPFP